MHKACLRRPTTVAGGGAGCTLIERNVRQTALFGDADAGGLPSELLYNPALLPASPGDSRSWRYSKFRA
jgi:hypothetical protein